jgi:hypothetical protein
MNRQTGCSHCNEIREQQRQFEGTILGDATRRLLERMRPSTWREWAEGEHVAPERDGRILPKD